MSGITKLSSKQRATKRQPSEPDTSAPPSGRIATFPSAFSTSYEAIQGQLLTERQSNLVGSKFLAQPLIRESNCAAIVP